MRDESGQFLKGQSGNQSGRPKGSRNKTTLAALNLLESESEKLSRKAVDMALNGDISALRLCLERIVPLAKERPLEIFKLPVLGNLQNVLEALGLVSQKLAKGELLPSEAKIICHLLDKYQQYYEVAVLAERLEALEKQSHLK